MAVLGPSGCGKSSLLRAVAGLATTRAGKIFFDDVEVTQDSPGDRHVGVVFQDYALYPHMESKRNLSFFSLSIVAPTRSKKGSGTSAASWGAGSRSLLDRKPRTLSGGEKQRVAVARCIIRDPTVFLLDEPLSNLDAQLRAQMRVQLKRLLRHFGVTAIYVTHDQSEAIALADRIAVMQSGRIVQVGTYRELYDRPHNTFVAGFLGEPAMNLLPGGVVRGHVRAGRWELPLGEDSLRILEGEEVTVGIRPEDVEISGEGTPDTIRLRVETVQPLVSDREQLTSFDFDGARLMARHDADPEIVRGTTVPIRLPAGNLRLFDRRGIRVI